MIWLKRAGGLHTLSIKALQNLFTSCDGGRKLMGDYCLGLFSQFGCVSSDAILQQLVWKYNTWCQPEEISAAAVFLTGYDISPVNYALLSIHALCVTGKHLTGRCHGHGNSCNDHQARLTYPTGVLWMIRSNVTFSFIAIGWWRLSESLVRRSRDWVERSRSFIGHHYKTTRPYVFSLVRCWSMYSWNLVPIFHLPLELMLH